MYRGLENPWPYRSFVVNAIRGEFKQQLARSRLGALWLILHPLARAAIFAIVFSEILVVRMPGISDSAGYAIYLIAGMCAWGLFNDIVTRTSTIFVDYAGTMKKIPVSHFCMPAIACGVSIFNHLLLLLALAVVFALLGKAPSPSWLGIVPGMMLITVFAAGLGLILGILNVFKRDVAQLTGIVLQIWFWLTPIVYVPGVLPEKFKWILEVNLLAPIIRIYQDAMLHDAYPAIEDLGLPLLAAVLMCLLSVALLRRASSDIVDAL